MADPKVLRDLALVFTKLGLTAFGGPAAHIAMMQRELVQEKRWVEEQRFMDLVGGVNLIPGPNSTELAIHIGHDRAGWRGLIIAGLCFILPAVLITGTIAHFYRLYGTLPQVQSFIFGIKPAIIGIMLGAVYPLARQSAKSMKLIVLGSLVLLLAMLGVNEILLLFGAGLAMLIAKCATNGDKRASGFFPIVLPALSCASEATNQKLFLIFLKVGALLYGSGYVLFSFLDAELVDRGMISRQQLIDAVAVGQFTPGPVFSSVTFVGYQINGWQGALVSTVGIFLPSFIFVALLNPLVKKMRASQSMSVFLDAVNIASVALIISVCFLMAKDTITDWRTTVIGIISIIVTFRYKKINSALIILGGAISGYLFLLF
ncbi:chromate efflux transporter [uncultured Flavobacterium sp.]|uniref:chromate efflux transporter n=1 Tax=uncultured Flavobacterium sp. TaxID=165435 RepID=UPI0025E4E944|nr:chromate efflux transporter [uncultured Flavobacterium sp.]